MKLQKASVGLFIWELSAGIAIFYCTFLFLDIFTSFINYFFIKFLVIYIVALANGFYTIRFSINHLKQKKKIVFSVWQKRTIYLFEFLFSLLFLTFYVPFNQAIYM